MIGQVTQDDISKEVLVITKLSERGHCNLIQVIAHGWLPTTSSIYYFDMKRCEYNLEHYIHHHNSVAASLPTDPSEDHSRFFNPLKTRIQILRQVLCGLVYIHNHEEVHGNLKPTNGMLTLR